MPQAWRGAVIGAAVTAVTLTATAAVAFFVLTRVRTVDPRDTRTCVLVVAALVVSGTAASAATVSWAMRAIRSSVRFEGGSVSFDQSATRIVELRDILTRAEEVRNAYINADATSTKLAEAHLRSVASADRVAHETATRLHNGVLQTVIATRFQLQMGNTSRSSEWLEEAERELRAVTAGLSPSISAGGLAGALIELCKERNTPLTMVRFTGDDVIDPPAATTATVLRVTAECIGNAKRWGSPSRIAVTLEDGEDHLTLTVTDNGSGFDRDARAEGFGLFAARSEVCSLGGTMEVSSAPGHGCTVKVCLPLSDRNEVLDPGALHSPKGFAV